ncbi:hypothetical protein F5884DRAFT_779058 [Xylogone sp. PMI_703]|nr:hypothetical protein F5884DRAFT_779058 [Xylogone sp. PMI_703]
MCRFATIGSNTIRNPIKVGRLLRIFRCLLHTSIVIFLNIIKYITMCWSLRMSICAILLLRCINAEKALEWAPGRFCPTEIHTTIPGGTYTWPGMEAPEFRTMSEVHSALLKCPNITTLDLRVTLLGCSEWPDRWNFPFDTAGGDKYPFALQSLSLEGYEFGISDEVSVAPPKDFDLGDVVDWIFSGRAYKWARQYHSTPTKPRTNLELWLDAMDFSQIHTLSLVNTDISRQEGSANLITELLVSSLSSLKSLHVEQSWARDLIVSLPQNALEHVSWINSGESIDPIVERHGASLTKLEWRSRETMSGIGPMISIEGLRDLGTRAPGLKDLTIDIKRNGTWPWNYMRSLSTTLPSLTDLTVYLEIASECRRQKPDSWYDDGPEDSCRGVKQYAQPLLNVTTGLEAFNFLRSVKIGDELTHVKFYSGDWARAWDGPLYIPEWIEGKRAWVECDIMFENGTRKAEGDVLCWGEDTVIPRYKFQQPEEY